MTATSRLPEADPLYAGPPPERPVYATGVLLDARDFTAEQTYHRGRLARALALSTGGGTLAGLRVSHAINAGGVEEIRVAPGVAIDRLGRLIELARPACLRLDRWWAATAADDLQRAAYAAEAPPGDAALGDLVSARVAAPDSLPARAVVADVFLRFLACEQGRQPAFASGPYDALDATQVSRLRDACELLLVARDGLDVDYDGLPDRGPDFAAIADPGDRRAALDDAVLDAWPADGAIQPAPEHPDDVDPSAQFIARLLIPVSAVNPPVRDGSGVLVDNSGRRFVPSAQLLQRWLGL